MVKDNDPVQPDTVVARAMLPGAVQTIKLAEKLGVEARDVTPLLMIKLGEALEKGQIVAGTKGMFGGRIGKRQIESDYAGTVEAISEISGHVLVREASVPVEINAYIQGKIVDILPEEGAIVETRCGMVQGIFGVGGERTGTIRVAVANYADELKPSDIRDDDKGKILVGGSGVSYEALMKATQVGANGIVVGGVKDSDLTRFLGYEIGVAITGQEAISLTLMVTEGFGFLSMAQRTFELLRSLEGKFASINGATQIRAGVIRPEIIVPLASDAPASTQSLTAFELKVGTAIRIIREPYFGDLGTVTDLPSTLQVVESGTEVRVLKARIEGKGEVTVPRANVEIIAT
jgi:hypothetical protein